MPMAVPISEEKMPEAPERVVGVPELLSCTMLDCALLAIHTVPVLSMAMATGQ